MDALPEPAAAAACLQPETFLTSDFTRKEILTLDSSLAMQQQQQKQLHMGNGNGKGM